mgnify:FL=1
MTCFISLYIRGLPGIKSPPFRELYVTLSELKSLLNNPRFVVCTATATSETKRKIYDVLCLSHSNTFSIEMSPDRSNLKYATQHVENNMELSKIFGRVIARINKSVYSGRTII